MGFNFNFKQGSIGGAKYILYTQTRNQTTKDNLTRRNEQAARSGDINITIGNLIGLF